MSGFGREIWWRTANDLRADYTKFWKSRQRDPAYFAEFDGLRWSIWWFASKFHWIGCMSSISLNQEDNNKTCGYYGITLFISAEGPPCQSCGKDRVRCMTCRFLGEDCSADIARCLLEIPRVSTLQGERVDTVDTPLGDWFGLFLSYQPGGVKVSTLWTI